MAEIKAETKAPTAEVKENDMEKTKSAVPAGKKSAGTQKQQFIYAGASLPGIPSGTVITGKIPDILDKPFIKELVIPIEEFTEFKKRLGVTESRAAHCFRKSIGYAIELNR